MEVSAQRPRFSSNLISTRQIPAVFPATKCFLPARCLNACGAPTNYAFRSLLDSGATLAFGTDWTVAPLDPLLSIYAAVTRRTLDGKHPNGWVPEQKISVEEAVRAYTVGSAFAEFQENEKGTLAPGKLADIVILSRDTFKIDPNEIEKIKVVMT